MDVSVIIPTLCNTSRATLLTRAIQSVVDRNNASVLPIVVVNGTVYDQGLYDELRSRSDLRVLYLESGGLPAALRFGREHVETEYFCFLDDDDAYLPGAVDVRLKACHDPRIDLVVTNGFRISGDRREVFAENMEAFGKDPLQTLFDVNWLPSCAGLYRSATIPAEFFDVATHYREWTYVAFQVARQRNIRFIDDRTFEINNTPGSLSKSAPYLLADARMTGKFLEFDVDRRTRDMLERRLADAFHWLSNFHLGRGNLDEAWNYHVQSLRCRSGLSKYALSTRHFVRPAIRSVATRLNR